MSTMFLKRKKQILHRLLHGPLVAISSAALTMLFFLVLPLIQAISEGPEPDLMVQAVDTANLPPPPPPPEEEPEPEEEQEEQPPELAEEAPPLDLSQLELALNPGMGGSWMSGDFGVKLNAIASTVGDVDALFSLADLDQRPRVVYQPSPVLDAKVRAKAPGTAYILFIVNQRGEVENPIVQSASDPVFERPALNAVKQWRFEPGKVEGQPVTAWVTTAVRFEL